MGKDVFIKNNTRYDMIVPIAAVVEDDRVLKKFQTTFRRRTVDPTTGNVLATGYTKLTKEEYDRHDMDETFKKQVRKGLLEVFGADDVPSDAMSEADIIESLQAQLEEAKAEIAALRALVEGTTEESDGSDEDAAKAKAKSKAKEAKKGQGK